MLVEVRCSNLNRGKSKMETMKLYQKLFFNKLPSITEPCYVMNISPPFTIIYAQEPSSNKGPKITADKSNYQWLK